MTAHGVIGRLQVAYSLRSPVHAPSMNVLAQECHRFERKTGPTRLDLTSTTQHASFNTINNIRQSCRLVTKPECALPSTNRSFPAEDARRKRTQTATNGSPLESATCEIWRANTMYKSTICPPPVRDECPLDSTNRHPGESDFGRRARRVDRVVKRAGIRTGEGKW